MIYRIPVYGRITKRTCERVDGDHKDMHKGAP